MLLLKQVPDPERFGVPVFDGGRLTRIEEKPKVPGSPFAVVGIYFYDHTVFDRIAKLQPSSRGELEITDVNNSYLADGQISYEVLKGWWTDAGTFESLWHASSLVKQKHEASHFQAMAAAGGSR
jgi:glucose-1-phosphate thymidylyltransferase